MRKTTAPNSWRPAAAPPRWCPFTAQMTEYLPRLHSSLPRLTQRSTSTATAFQTHCPSPLLIPHVFRISRKNISTGSKLFQRAECAVTTFSTQERQRLHLAERRTCGAAYIQLEPLTLISVTSQSKSDMNTAEYD